MSLTRLSSDLITFLPNTFKTIDGQSIVGSGNISVNADTAGYIKKTADYTAVNADYIIADTSGGAFTITLPSTPTVGSRVSIVDGANWGTNNLTINRNGSTIEDASQNLVLNSGGIAVDLIFTGSTWQVYNRGGNITNLATLTGTETLTNKTLSLGSNTITGTLAQFNAAITDADVATLTGTETLTNKTINSATLTSATLNGGYTEQVYAMTSGTTISASNGSIQTKTLSGPVTFTENLSNGQSVILGITAGNYAVTWPTTSWSKIGGGGTAPSLTSTGVNWIVLWKVGEVLRGSFLGTT